MLILCHLKSGCVVRPGPTANEVSLAVDGCQNYRIVLTFSKQIHKYGNQTQLISFVVVDPWVRPDMTLLKSHTTYLILSYLTAFGGSSYM